MSKLGLSKMLIDGEVRKWNSAHVYDQDTGKSVKEQIAAIESQIASLSGADVDKLKTDLAQLKTTFDTFMTGEDDNNGALDRLKELVAAIETNKDSIDALVADKVTKAELDALVARVKTLEDKNWQLLDGLGKNEATGNLTFNGKELTGETGIAIGASVEEAVKYDGKIQIILEEFEIADAEPAA